MFFRNRFSPYSDKKLMLLRHLLERRPGIPGIKYLPHVLMFGLGIFATLGFEAVFKVRRVTN